MSFWNAFFLLLIYIPLIMVWGFAVLDIFRRDDIHGGSKALWLVVVIFLPFLGTLIYLIARGSGMTERSLEAQRKMQAAQADYIRSVASKEPAAAGAGAADQIASAKSLLDSGTITQAEFDQLKAKALA